jgi:hypothetical protein
MTAPPKAEQEPRPAPLVQLCVFDARRGREEGQEAEKVLGYYPADVPPDEQSSVVGLVQAVSAFSAIFSQVGPVSVGTPAPLTECTRLWCHACVFLGHQDMLYMQCS